MSVQQSTSTDTIPLRCIICPKKPRFSDVSHLLTHLSSKAHLSHHFKADTKGDAETQRLLDEFKQWYNKHGLKELLATRLEQKESKKGTSRSGIRSAAHGATSTPAPSSRRVLKRARDETVGLEAGHPPQAHPDHYTGFPGGYYLLESAVPPGYAPAYPWSAYPAVYGHAPLAASPIPKQESLDSDVSEMNGTPSSDYRPLRRKSTQTSVSNHDARESMEETNVEATKMKGIVWDGMSMFDSATPDMKRKRNQRKQYCVADQLSANSRVIMPSEFVFDQTWVHRRTRPITGNADDATDSPLEGEEAPEPAEPAKKRAARRPRQPLAPRNANSGRITRRGSQPGTRQARKPNTRAEVDVENQLTYALDQPARARTFNVHRDGTENSVVSPSQPMMGLASHAPFNSMHGLPAPTIEGYHHHPMATSQAQYGYSFQRQPGFDTLRSHEDLLNLYSRGFASFGQLNYHGQAVGSFNPLFNMYGHNPYTAYSQLGHHGLDANVGSQIDHDLFQQQEVTDWQSTGAINQDLNIPDTNDDGFTAQDESQASTTISGGNAQIDDNDTISAPASER